MPDPIKDISHLNQIRNFSEEASFYIAMYRQHPVKPVPDPALLLVLNKLWLKQKKRRVSKKERIDKLWLSKNPQCAVQRQEDEPDELD